MQVECFNFFMLSPAKMGHFFLDFTLFSLIKTQILALQGMMNVYIQWFIVLTLGRSREGACQPPLSPKVFLSFFKSHNGTETGTPSIGLGICGFP